MIGSASLEGVDDTATVQIAPAARIDRPVPAVLDLDPRIPDQAAELAQRSAGSRVLRCPPLLCSRIEGGSVATSAAIALTARGRWVVESIDPAPVAKAVPVRRLRRIRIDAQLQQFDEAVAIVYSVLSPKKQANYYHWTLEGLTRAAMLAEAAVPPSAKVLVPAPVTELHVQSLAAVGVESSRILEWPGVLTRFPVVFLPTGPQHRGFCPPPAAISLLRRAALRDACPGSPSWRVWISRRLARRRRMHGEDELLAVARRLGFEEVIAEELDVSAQIALFARAEAVAGIHGAGLANALFMPPGGALIEAAPNSLKSRQKPFFWNLAAACGHRYACYVGSDAGFDPTRFERVLAQALSPKRD